MTRSAYSRSVKWMFAGNVITTALVVAMLVGFSRPTEPVLIAERLNIVDANGAPVLVLSNAARLPGGTFGGKEYPQSFTGRGKSAGMIFFNEAGDEVGGLIFEGAARDSSYRAFGHLSFDQWKQNQVVAVQYSDDGSSRSAGLRVWDRPTDAPLEEQFSLAERMLETAPGAVRDSLDTERRRVRDRVSGTQRVFLGSRNRDALLELRDQSGLVRAALSVDSAGTAHLVFFDSQGQVTAIYP